VNELSSLLYRDEGANGGIRVRHLSISDFFVSDHCAFQISPRDTNVRLGIACLKTMVGQLRFNICKLEDSRLANADVGDLPTRIKQNISDSLQYSSLYWSNHLCSTPDNGDQRVWENLEEFFEGLFALFWIEVLSIMGKVSIGAPSLRRVISWAEVSTVIAGLYSKMTPTCCRVSIQLLSRGFRTFAVSSSLFIPPSLSALHTPIFQRDPSYPHGRLYQPPSEQGSLKPSRCKEGNCCHGRRRH
jgi:hypothetical protein